jgi:hypothetical protein
MLFSICTNLAEKQFPNLEEILPDVWVKKVGWCKAIEGFAILRRTGETITYQFGSKLKIIEVNKNKSS